MLTIFHLDEAGNAEVVARVETAVGARTAALDEETGRLYLAAPVERQGGAPSKAFQVLVVAP